MPKVCRIVKSKNLNKRKYDELCEQANLLGSIRKEVWHRFGSVNGVGVNHRKIRDEWVKTREFSPLPAKAWKETLRDTLDDISLYEEACKVKVKQDIASRTNNKDERKRLYTLLKKNEWPNDPFLSRKMRKYKKHGRTNVSNQIILEGGVYSQFLGKDGNTWLKVPTFERGRKLCIPLNSNIKLKGCLRLIMKDGYVQIHYAIKQKKFAKCGDEILGIDKGYSEAFADSEGDFYGENLGKVLTSETENRNRRGKARNKLFQISKKKLHKAANIQKYNLGRKKLNRNIEKKKILVRDIAFESAHRIVDKAVEVRTEDLTKPFSSKEKWKRYNRLMSAWAKGSLAEALESVTKARGSCLRVVNAAYTSQMDSKTGRLEGRRVGDKFHHVNGEVSQADTNAAVNIKHRADDTEISLYTPYKEVKAILLNRLAAIGRVSSPLDCDRPSRTPVTREK
ncbi:transposase, partial [Pseudobacteriovorax antillogorgiicola]